MPANKALWYISGIGAVVVFITVGAYVLGVNPFETEDDGLSAERELNREQIQRITGSPYVASVALPLEVPPGLQFVQAVHTEPTGSEVHFQQGGLSVVVCGGTLDDSACDADTATVFRTTEVDGERVRVAWVDSDDMSAKATAPPSAAEWEQVADFWENVDLQLGTVPWLHDFA